MNLLPENGIDKQNIISEDFFQQKREQAKQIYNAQKSIRSPYLGVDVIFNSDGFHHLQFSARRERDKKEQFVKTPKIKTFFLRVFDSDLRIISAAS